MIKNATQLQQNIIDICNGERIDTVIHALEIIKLDLLLNITIDDKRDNNTTYIK